MYVCHFPITNHAQHPQRLRVTPAPSMQFVREESAASFLEPGPAVHGSLNNLFDGEGRISVPRASQLEESVVDGSSPRRPVPPRINQGAPAPLSEPLLTQTTVNMKNIDVSGKRPRPLLSQFRHMFTFGRNPMCRGDFLYHPLSGTMPYTLIAEYRWRSFAFEFIDVILRGLGQV